MCILVTSSHAQLVDLNQCFKGGEQALVAAYRKIAETHEQPCFGGDTDANVARYIGAMGRYQHKIEVELAEANRSLLTISNPMCAERAERIWQQISPPRSPLQQLCRPAPEQCDKAIEQVLAYVYASYRDAQDTCDESITSESDPTGYRQAKERARAILTEKWSDRAFRMLPAASAVENAGPACINRLQAQLVKGDPFAGFPLDKDGALILVCTGKLKRNIDNSIDAAQPTVTPPVATSPARDRATVLEPDKLVAKLGPWRLSTAMYGVGCVAEKNYSDHRYVRLSAKPGQPITLLIVTDRKQFVADITNPEGELEFVEVAMEDNRWSRVHGYGYRGTPGVVLLTDDVFLASWSRSRRIKITERGKEVVSVAIEQSAEVLSSLQGCLKASSRVKRN